MRPPAYMDISRYKGILSKVQGMEQCETSETNRTSKKGGKEIMRQLWQELKQNRLAQVACVLVIAQVILTILLTLK